MAPGPTQPPDPRTDAQLVDAINTGNEAAFEALYRRHRDWVVNLAYRFTDDRDLALDVMQETFLYLLGKFPGFELRAKLTTFLYPAVRHIAATHREKARRLNSGPAGGDEAMAELTNGHTDPTRPRDPREELAAALSALSDEQREVVLMRFVDGLTLKEIAAALSIPLGTVKSRLHLAIAALRADPHTREFFENR